MSCKAQVQLTNDPSLLELRTLTIHVKSNKKTVPLTVCQVHG